MSPGDQAKQMETLCNLYVAEKNKAEKEKILRELKRFTYFQCQPKMLQRFNIKLHPFCSESFHGVFRPDAISNFELSSRFEEDNAAGITPKMLRYDESKFLGTMKKLTGYTFTADEKQKSSSIRFRHLTFIVLLGESSSL